MQIKHLSIAALAACALATTASPAYATRAAFGTGADRETLFVEGDNAVDRVHLKMTSDDRVGVRDTGSNGISPGSGCRRTIGPLNVSCRRPIRIVVRLYGDNDEARVYRSVRNESKTEVWGGDGRDNLKAEPGDAQTFLLGQADDDSLFGSSAGGEALWGGPGDDDIFPGGGRDHIDGGHGDFNRFGPVFRRYSHDQEVSRADPYRTQCEARSDGFLDRKYENDADNIYYSAIFNYVVQGYHEGEDDLWLQGSPSGALADLNVCRLGYFGTNALSLVHAIENVHGTRYNDRLVGDHEDNLLYPGAGRDWIDSEPGSDRVYARDGEVDTIVCDGTSGDGYQLDYEDTDRNGLIDYGRDRTTERLVSCLARDYDELR
jgi:RTX calcium-binding nonapeptide repeat (4 copies)